MPDVKPLKIGTAPVAVEEFGSGDTIPAASVSGLGTMATQAAADYVTVGGTEQVVTGPKRFTAGATSDSFSARFEGAGGTNIVAAGNVSGNAATVSAYTAGFAAPAALQLQHHGGVLNIGGSTAVNGALSATNAATGAVASSGTTQTNLAIRAASSATSGVIDIGMNGATPWIQATDRTDLSQRYTLALNPGGGAVTVGSGGLGVNTSPSFPLHVIAPASSTEIARIWDASSFGFRFISAAGSPFKQEIRVGGGEQMSLSQGGTDMILLSSAGAAVNGAATATTNVEAGKSLLVSDVYQISAVTTAGQTRAFDLANGAVQTLSANQAFTLTAAGPAGKAGYCTVHVYNAGGADLVMTRGTGFQSSGSINIPAGSTYIYFVLWDGYRALILTNNVFSGDLRPT